jgi:hypothetical protein
MKGRKEVKDLHAKSGGKSLEAPEKIENLARSLIYT